VTRLFPLLLLGACEAGLASLWQAPQRVDAGQPLRVAPVVALTGRLGLAASASAPDRLEPTPGDLLRPVLSKSLGQGLWLVRVQRPLVGTGALDSLSLHVGFPLTFGEVEKRLKGMPMARLGLSLDRHLRIVADHRGASRRGAVVSCDGDPVQNKLHLMACLALDPSRQPSLEIEPPPLPRPDAGARHADVGSSGAPDTHGDGMALDAGHDGGQERLRK